MIKQIVLIENYIDIFVVLTVYRSQMHYHQCPISFVHARNILTVIYNLHIISNYHYAGVIIGASVSEFVRYTIYRLSIYRDRI